MKQDNAKLGSMAFGLSLSFYTKKKSKSTVKFMSFKCKWYKDAYYFIKIVVNSNCYCKI